jgi:putative pyruvate formate lyase activating enzyme
MPGIEEAYPELGRRVTRREYERVLDYALSLGITQAYVQEGETAKESFIPAFDGEGLL